MTQTTIFLRSEICVEFSIIDLFSHLFIKTNLLIYQQKLIY